MYRAATLLLLVIALFITSAAMAAEEYNAALQRARSEKKPVILFFYSKTCGYCQLMEEESFKDRELASIAAKSLVFVRIDGDERRDLARLFAVRGYPTMWFLDESGRRLGQRPGYASRKELRNIYTYLSGGFYRSMSLQDFLRAQKG